jgi:molybdenum cofactor guanylyltransferase
MPQPTGILLAGGASRRFGRDKRLEPFEGRPLFMRPLTALLVRCDEVIVALAPDAATLPLPPDVGAVRFVHDDAAYQGPLAGCARALREVRGDLAVVAAADMPGLTGGVVALLAEASRGDAVVLADGEGWRPLPAALRAAKAREVADRLLANGERRLRALIDRLQHQVIAEERWSTVDPRGAWRKDVNEPADLGGEGR